MSIFLRLFRPVKESEQKDEKVELNNQLIEGLQVLQTQRVKELEDNLKEALQVLTLENKKINEDFTNIIEATSALMTTVKALKDLQNEQTLRINSNIVALTKVLNCLIDKGILDPDEPDPTLN